MKIVLLGYMASGKSTIGKCLSKNIGIPFIDLDRFIEEQEKKSISLIFKEDGEVFFRLKEHKYLKQLLNRKENFVLSLGGGTPCYAGNIDLINADRNSASIYLKTTIQTIVNRLQKEKINRPIVANLADEEIKEFVAKHLFERSFFYEQANIKIHTDGKLLYDIVDEIIITLNKL